MAASGGEPPTVDAEVDGDGDRGPVALRRVLSLPVLVLYGLGTTIGAGIYALTGEVAGAAGMWAFASFAAAAVLAGFTGASYAALCSRHPRVSAEAVFVREAFHRRRLAALVALTIAFSAAVSAAAVTKGFHGYLGELVELPALFAIVGIVALLGGVAAIGIRESVVLASSITAIEIGGLLLVVAYASPALLELPARLGDFSPSALPAGPGGVFVGSLLAFYAFMGFEDLANAGEEVKDVRRTLPLAIGLTLALTMLIYVVVALVAVLAVPPGELAASPAPLARIFERSGGRPELLGAVGVLAMLNGALVQILMASRILYGLARSGDLPAWLSRVNPRTRTPVAATALVSVAVAGLALWLPLARLAEAASILTLLAFAFVDASLLRIQQRDPAPPGVLVLPQVLPAAGVVVSLGFVVARIATWVAGGPLAGAAH